MHRRAASSGFAQAVAEQRHIMPRGDAHQQRRPHALDVGQRQFEGRAGGVVGEILHAQAVVDRAAAQSACDRGQQMTFLAGRQRRHQQAGFRAGGPEAGGGSDDRLVPRGFDQRTVATDHRIDEAVLGVQPLVAVTVAVRQPALVDRLVVARDGTQYLTPARVQPEVRPQRIVVADRLARNQFPGASAKAKDLVGERADRADVHHVAGQFGLHRLADVGADLEVLAAPHAAKLMGAGDLAGEAHTARAMDAARHVGGDQRTEILVGHHTLALDESADRAAIAHRHVLQLALAALVADRAVERMVDEQELHHVALRVKCALGLGVDLHPVHHRRGAGRHGLGRLLDVDQAHAAVGRDRQLVVIAETRDADAGLVGGLDDHRPLRHLHGAAIDLDGDQVRRGVGGGRLCAHRCGVRVPGPALRRRGRAARRPASACARCSARTRARSGAGSPAPATQRPRRRRRSYGPRSGRRPA